MDSGLTVLLVEDNAAEARLLEEHLAELPPQHPIALVWVETVAQAAAELSHKNFDAMLLDLSLPDSMGLDTVDKANELAPRIPVIVFTSLDDERVAIESLRRGAQDYLIKGRTDGPLLARALRYAIQRRGAAAAAPAGTRGAAGGESAPAAIHGEPDPRRPHRRRRLSRRRVPPGTGQPPLHPRLGPARGRCARA